MLDKYVEARKTERELLLQNFLSVDGKTAINSYGEVFVVGETVGHEGTKEGDTAVINYLAASIEDNEIVVFTTKGTAHLDFLVKL
jgi:hypothetical protein